MQRIQFPFFNCSGVRTILFSSQIVPSWRYSGFSCNRSFCKKFYLTINDPLPVLPGNEQDLGHENIVNTFLPSIHIVCFGNHYANTEKSWHLMFRRLCLNWCLIQFPPNTPVQYTIHNSGNVGRIIYCGENSKEPAYPNKGYRYSPGGSFIRLFFSHMTLSCQHNESRFKHCSVADSAVPVRTIFQVQKSVNARSQEAKVKEKASFFFDVLWSFLIDLFFCFSLPFSLGVDRPLNCEGMCRVWISISI